MKIKDLDTIKDSYFHVCVHIVVRSNASLFLSPKNLLKYFCTIITTWK